MDQQSVESLLRRLVERVEVNERRYSEALDELNARIDRLSQATEAVRAASSAEDAETFDRLHDQVSSLARRLERESTPLDDFERLGRALSGELNYAAGMMAKPDLLSELAASPLRAREPSFGERAAYDHGAPAPAASVDDRDLHKRLMEMAHRLERSINTSMPTQALEALQARLDEIGEQIARAVEQAPKGAAIDALETKISDLAQQAEGQLARIGEIDATLHQLIERMDGRAGEIEAVAGKAAEEAARRVAEDAKLSAGTVERLDAMHRDLMAMNDRTRASDDRIVSTIEAVHDSLKKLVQRVEQNPPQTQTPKPKPLSFADRLRELAPTPGAAPEPLVKPRSESVEAVIERPAGRDGAAARPKLPLPRNRLREAITDLDSEEMAPNFGRAKRVPGETKPVDLDQPEPQAKSEDAEYEAPDDLVAAARRAAQAAALKVEERGGGARLRKLPGDAEPAPGGEFPSRRKRPFLIICAAVLLAISALLLYSRLRTKPESEIVPPSVEQSAPLPEAPAEGGASTPDSDEAGPAAAEPGTPPASPADASEPPARIEASPSIGERREPGNVTNIAKSAFHPAYSSELTPQAEPAALKATETPPLPPGVVFSIEDPTLVPREGAAAPTASPIP